MHSAPSGGNEDKQSEETELQNGAQGAELSEAREVREAGKRNKDKGVGRRRRRRKGRKGGKAGKGGNRRRKGRKNRSRRRSRNNGGKRNKGGKGSGNKSKGGRRRGGKGGRRRRLRNNGARQTSTPPNCLANRTCVDNIIVGYKILANQVVNFNSQKNRIARQNKTGKGKSDKKGAFKAALNRLIKTGGGNRSNPSCAAGANAAAQITNLTTVLHECQDNIKAACDPSNFPAVNKTKLDMCTEASTKYKTMIGVCSNATATTDAKVCSCFGDAALVKLRDTMKTCVCK